MSVPIPNQLIPNQLINPIPHLRCHRCLRLIGENVENAENDENAKTSVAIIGEFTLHPILVLLYRTLSHNNPDFAGYVDKWESILNVIK